MLKNINPEQLGVVLDLLKSYLLYAVLALAVILIIAALAYKFFAPNKLAAYGRACLFIALGFAIGVIFCIGTLEVSLTVLESDITPVFWVTLGLIGLICAVAVACVIVQIAAPKAFKTFTIIAFCVIAVYAVVLIVLTVPARDEECEPISPALFYGISIALAAILCVIPLVFGKKQSKTQTTKSITYAAVCIALSYALSYIKLFSMPQGGSVTLASLLPIMLYSYMFGVRRGVVCCVIYGTLQFLQSPQAYQPMQVLLDYPVAFGFAGFAGLFRGILPDKRGMKAVEFCIGAVIAICLRYASHVISGTFVFHYGAGLNEALITSVIYNSYTLVDLVIVLIVGVFVLLNKAFIRQVDKITAANNEG